jgi:hypothetical protein
MCDTVPIVQTLPSFFSLFLCADMLLDLKSLEPNYWVVSQFHPGRKNCKYGEILNTYGDVIRV